MACSPYFLPMLNVNTELLEQLDPNEMWLLLHIAKRISKERTAFPSKKTLLKDTRWKTERTLNAALEALVEKGFISVTRRLPRGAGYDRRFHNVERTPGYCKKYRGWGAKKAGGTPAKNAGGRGSKNAPP